MFTFSKQVNSFIQLLQTVDANGFDIKPYPKYYLNHLLQNKTFYINLFAWTLDKTVEDSLLKKEEIILVDFGAGNGLLSLFAKYCGINKVYACEVREEFVVAIKQLAQELNIQIDGYIIGNENQLPAYFEAINKPNVFIGTDVIEHVYSINNLIQITKRLNDTMLVGFTTGSVYDNYFKRKSLFKLMYKDEYIGSNALHAKLENEYAGMAFLEVRKQLIKKAFSTLNDSEINTLATATRGLNEADIYKTVNSFLQENRIPLPPTNSFNTCDPITGSFTEQMLTINQYKTIFKNSKYNLTIYNGFYNEYQKGIKGILLRFVNSCIHLFPKQYCARIVSPTILLIGK